MAIGFKIKVDARQVRRNINGFLQDIKPSRLLNAIGDRHLKWVNDNFKREGLESKWKKLSPNTIAGRRKGSRKVLQDTGRLRQSFVKKVKTDRVEVGTQSKIAKFHHEGTGPFTIRPRKARVLRFAVAGGVAFAKEVRHPGLAKRPLLPTVPTGEKLARAVMNAALERAAQRASK